MKRFLFAIYPFVMVFNIMALIWFIWTLKVPILVYQITATFALFLYATIFILMCLETIKYKSK